MNKPISRPMHGFTDYPYVAAVSSAPKIFGFEDEAAAVRMCRLLSGGILVSSILTRAEWGFLRAMPYKMHLVLDVLGGATALASPWLFSFSSNKHARNTFIAIGAFGLMAGLLSRTEEIPE